MNKPDISALADDISEIVEEKNNITPKDTGLIKLFIKAFILLLCYLILDKFISGKFFASPNGGVNVVGIFYGPVNKKSPDTLLINLGKEDQLNSGAHKTQNLNVDKLPDKPTKPIVEPPKPTPSKLELLSKAALGAEMQKVITLLGAPNQKFNVVLDKDVTGYVMCVWTGKPEIRLMFYKDKLISKITK
jgi:hypothetical protein